MTSDEGDAVIVRSTIEMGRNLGLRLVAEGVEDAATLDLLRTLGVRRRAGLPRRPAARRVTRS